MNRKTRKKNYRDNSPFVVRARKLNTSVWEARKELEKAKETFKNLPDPGQLEFVKRTEAIIEARRACYNEFITKINTDRKAWKKLSRCGI